MLLQQVKQEVDSRLEQSLHNRVFIVLGKHKQPEQVKRLWDAEVKIGSKPAEPLLPQTSILEVFERADIAGQLLILGAPGAGKTTTMLELAQSLIEKAIQDSSYPIPVLFNLSSWKDPHQSIPTWLVEELNLKYGVRKDIGKKLIEGKQLLPTLDGLDEVKPEHQEACVNSINQWLQGDDRPLYVVVCSRREEYINYESRLYLGGAIVLQELTDAQIREYLTGVKRFELWPLLQKNEVLLELVKNPLLLSITVLSYEELSLQKWQQLTSTKQQIKMLLDGYVQRMFHREIKSRAYRKLTPRKVEQIQHWLYFLAWQLQQESRTEFLIEQLQPSWLSVGKQERLYELIVGLITGLLVSLILTFTLILTLTFTLAGSLFHSGFWKYLEPKVVLIYMLFFLLFVGSLIVMHTRLYKKIEVVEGFRFSFKEAKKPIICTLKVIFGFSFVVPLFFYREFLLKSILLGLVWGLYCILTHGILFGLKPLEINIKNNPNQGIWKSAANALYIALISGLSIQLVLWLNDAVLDFGVPSDMRSSMQISRLTIMLIRVLNYAVLLGIPFGGLTCIKHFSLRLILFKNGHIPWNYARFLNYCTERGFLQRVGGRYRFIHKQLQDHFAEM
ncbi:MAG: hypothetical protein KME05_23260 [Gloeocapsa sp. UFS-A4-WI-NPMV-4B04]|nr:hypothetical protein [Gloeocapsa sp. UFS-A4-WI-NPMV-4B04]